MYQEWSKDRPTRYPTHEEIQGLDRLTLKAPDPMAFVREQAMQTLDDLKTCRVPAADLTEYQKFAILFLAGLMKWDGENGKFVSIHPVGIADRGDGGYIIGSDPSR